MSFYSFFEKIDYSIANLIKYIHFLHSILIYFETCQTMPGNQMSTRNKTNDSKKGKKDKKNEDPKKKLIRRRIIESDDDDDDFLEDDDEEEEEEDDEDDDYETIDSTEDDDDSEEYENNSDCSSSSESDDEDDDDEDSEDVKSPKRKKRIQKKKSKKTEKEAKKTKNKKSKKTAKKSKHNHDESESEEEEEDEYEEDDSEYDDDDSKGAEIILSFDAFGGGALNTDETEYKKMVKEDKNEECDSDDEKTFMKETYVPVTMPKTHSASELTNLFVNSMCPSKEKLDKKKKDKDEKDKDGKKKKKKADTDEEDNTPVEKKYAEMTQLKKTLTEQLSKNPKNKILQNAVQECRKSISELVKKERKKNTEKYYELVSLDEDKRNTNEMSYFKKKLSHKEQMKVMNDLAEINKFTNIDKPYRLALLESNIEPKIKAIVLQKLNVLKSMQPSDSEYYKMKNWVDGFMRVPHGVYKSLEVKMSDGIDKCHTFIESAKETLDNCVYGLNDAKMQIMQMLGQLLTNPKSIGTAIAIHGPPGTGKTSLVKEGISKILDRPFAFIALGGATDSSFLEGHSYTYEGSTWGKIVQIMIDSKCMNPVIYFDELDKISDTPRGEEIAGILTHLTDTSQNSQFHDKYFAEINFDLSKCLFIFSYNDESKVNPILKDRMYRIETKGYNQKQKTCIGNNYLLPKIREQIKFSEKDIIIPDESLHHIIDNHCNKEDGVRNLKRCLEIIYTKLNLYRLMKPDKNLFEEELSLKVEFPFTVTKDIIDKLIKRKSENISAMYSMYL